MMKKMLLMLMHAVVIGTSGILLVYNLFINDKPDYVRIVQCIVVLGGYLYGVRRMGKNIAGSDYTVYEDAYKGFIEGAFAEDKKSYRKLLEATACFSNGDYKKGQKMLDSLVKKCVRAKDYAAVYTFKGLCSEKENKNRQAIADYEKALQYDMANSRVWSNLGVRYFDMGKYNEAYDAYSNAILYNPENACAHCNIATCLIQMEEPEAALEHALQAIELNANLCEGMSAASIAYHMIGDEKNSQKYYVMYGLNGGNVNELRNALELL